MVQTLQPASVAPHHPASPGARPASAWVHLALSIWETTCDLQAEGGSLLAASRLTLITAVHCVHCFMQLWALSNLRCRL